MRMTALPGVRVVLFDRDRDAPGRAAGASEGRITIRDTVADVLAVPSADIRVEQRCVRCGGTDHGRPVVLAPTRRIWVSLSRTEGVLAVAVGRRGPVGVDVERVSNVARARVDVGPGGTTPGESTPGETTTPGATTMRETTMRETTTLWAAKEAVLKADGRGLAVDMRRVVPDATPIGANADGGFGPAVRMRVAEGRRFPVRVARLDEDLVLAVSSWGTAFLDDRRRP